MLAEERFAAILSILQKQKTVTVLELTQALSISESTIRRDLVALHKMGRLKKVHGGATLLHKEYGLYETEVAARSEEHVEEKKRIARYAASLIQAHDFVYIDAGSTTLHMVEYLKEEEAIYVTNGLEHGRRLAAQGFRTFLLAGELKSRTEAVVGLGAVSSVNSEPVPLSRRRISVMRQLSRVRVWRRNIWRKRILSRWKNDLYSDIESFD